MMKGLLALCLISLSTSEVDCKKNKRKYLPVLDNLLKRWIIPSILGKMISESAVILQVVSGNPQHAIFPFVRCLMFDHSYFNYGQMALLRVEVHGAIWSFFIKPQMGITRKPFKQKQNPNSKKPLSVFDIGIFPLSILIKISQKRIRSRPVLL